MEGEGEGTEGGGEVGGEVGGGVEVGGEGGHWSAGVLRRLGCWGGVSFWEGRGGFEGSSEGIQRGGERYHFIFLEYIGLNFNALYYIYPHYY